MTPEERVIAWTRRVGSNIRVARAVQRMSARELADRCFELGFRVTRNTIAALENGRKETIAVHEIAVMAKALGVPMADLIRAEGLDLEDSVPSLRERQGQRILDALDASATWPSSRDELRQFLAAVI